MMRTHPSFFSITLDDPNEWMRCGMRAVFSVLHDIENKAIGSETLKPLNVHLYIRSWGTAIVH